ncbi:hypothetical protein MLD38_003329 [Melastoma candidum]|uniref:Uncharacterized protein n=1 Tax=Melastoma candidum TaxID=119954 RepID=A0ACB9S2G9_9MYRT|nr:hypothetical protein MLD38_003329 [Melastoma candidum]
MENGQQPQQQQQQQLRGEPKSPRDGKKVDLEGLPMKGQYDNLEDYKLKAYGTQGHQEPVQGRGVRSQRFVRVPVPHCRRGRPSPPPLKALSKCI